MKSLQPLKPLPTDTNNNPSTPLSTDTTLETITAQETSKPNTPRLDSLDKQIVGSIRHYGDGEVIFWQGDVGGESFKILRGQVRVVLTLNSDGTQQSDWRKGKEVATIPKGEEFGGMSKLNPSHTRTATCIAIGNVKIQLVGVVRLQLPDLNAPLVHNLADKKEEEAQKASGLQNLMETVTYKHGEFICRQGEVGDCFYIITTGNVDVRIEMEDDVSKNEQPELWGDGGKLVHKMTAGEIFGERAVLSDDPVRTANCIANGIVNILKMKVTMETLLENKELRQLLERRKKQLNKQSKTKSTGESEDRESNEDEEDEILTPRAHAHDYDQYDDALLSALDDALDNRSSQINAKRDRKNKAKDAVYLKKRMCANETAMGRLDVVTGELEGTAGAFDGDYDDFVENGILFSDDSSDDEEDGSMDAIIKNALKEAQEKKKTKQAQNKHGKKTKTKKHHHDSSNKKQNSLVENSSAVGLLISQVTAMSPEDRMGGGWGSAMSEATALLISMVQQNDAAMAADALHALACKPGGARTDQLNWSVQENKGPLLDVNRRDPRGLSPTHHAAHLGSLKMLELLVDTWKADLSAMDSGYSVWAHALNSVSKGLGCTQQVLDWLEIRGAEQFHSGKVAEYTEEFREEFDAHKKKAEKAARKAARHEARKLDGHHDHSKHGHHDHSKHGHHDHSKHKKHKHKKKSKDKE